MRKILVVEDEIHIQRLLKMILEKNGFEVEAASNGEEGLRLASDFLPDLVLLDIMMPGIDGMQVLRSLKANSQTKDIPVVMLTALAQESVVIKGIQLGASDYLRKPFHPIKLVERINKIIEKAEAKVGA